MKNRLTPVFITITAITASALVFVNSCTKDTNADTETTSATDNNICEGEFMRIMPTVNSIAIDESGVRLSSGSGPHVASCPTISIDSSQGWPRTMTLDYGTGCTDGVDGKVRKGKIRVTVDRHWDTTGCVINIALDSFYVGAIQYQGTMNITRTSATSFHQAVVGGHCSKAGSSPWDIYYDSDRDISFTQGANNSSVPQIITITGSNSGTDRNGKHWTSTITSPIVRDLSCTWITKGTFQLTPEGKSMRTVDFGNGTCDNKGTITIDNNTFEFTMQ